MIIFAAAATSVSGQVMCLEEPEIHLHPRLQKRLMAYLREDTDNTYLVTTHSAHLLDTQGASLFHVALNEHGETTVSYIAGPSARVDACFDLGYRPSDLIQANCIVWVEGPSDRIYIRAWLEHLAVDLIEGEHYSIMFYGGRLLSHLSASEEGGDQATDFIALQRLNRRVAVLIDSDKASKADPIRATKERVKAETEAMGGFAWVTEGREIENYVSSSAMAEALTEVHPAVQFAGSTSPWHCAYEPANKKSSVDKMAVARHVVARGVDLDVLDLRQQVERLVAFIRESNR